MILSLSHGVRFGASDFEILKPLGDILCVSVQGEKVVKLPEGPYPGFPDMDGRIIEFSREGRQMQVYDIPNGLKLTDAGKGPELAQAYRKGLDVAV